MKPGSQEPWTPYRITEAFYKAGVPREAISLYAGPAGDVGGALLNASGRSLIFGGQQTVDIYKSNPRVQAHGPGFSKVIIAEDEIDNWEKYIDFDRDQRVCQRWPKLYQCVSSLGPSTW